VTRGLLVSGFICNFLGAGSASLSLCNFLGVYQCALSVGRGEARATFGAGRQIK